METSGEKNGRKLAPQHFTALELYLLRTLFVMKGVKLADHPGLKKALSVRALTPETFAKAAETLGEESPIELAYKLKRGAGLIPLTAADSENTASYRVKDFA